MRDGEKVYQSYNYQLHSILDVFINPFDTLQDADDHAFAQNYGVLQKGLPATIDGIPHRWSGTEWLDEKVIKSLIGNPANQTISIVDRYGNIIDTMSVGWLNNEGTTLNYNNVDNTIEIINDEGTVLSAIPVSSFVEGLGQNLNLNGYNVQLRDSTNAVLSSIDLQPLFDEKADTNLSNVSGSISQVDGHAFLDKVGISEVGKTGDYNDLINKEALRYNKDQYDETDDASVYSNKVGFTIMEVTSPATNWGVATGSVSAEANYGTVTTNWVEPQRARQTYIDANNDYAYRETHPVIYPAWSDWKVIGEKIQVKVLDTTGFADPDNPTPAEMSGKEVGIYEDAGNVWFWDGNSIIAIERPEVQEELKNYQIIPTVTRTTDLDVAMTGDVVWFHHPTDGYVGGYSLQDNLEPSNFDYTTVNVKFGFGAP